MNSIKFKVAVPVYILALLSCIASIFSYNDAKGLYKKAEVIAETYLTNTQTVGEMGESTQKMCRLIYALGSASTDDDMQNLFTQTKEEMADIEALIESFDNGLTDQEQEYFDEFKSIYESRMLTNFNELLALNDLTTVKYVITSNGSGLSNICNDVEDALTSLSELEEELAYESVEDMEDTYINARNVAVIFIALSIIIFVGAVVLTLKTIIKPLQTMNSEFNNIRNEIGENNGDLTKRVTILTKDEVASLGNGLNNFIAVLQDIISKIKATTTQLDDIVNTVSCSVNTSNGNVQDVSAALEQLSATMEEISSSLQSISESTSSVGSEVDVISDSTADLNGYSKEMLKRAEDMSKSATQSKTQVSNMIGNIMDSLKQSIEDSKSVEKVNDLTNEILSISSQTNLLALNASIEAARAGEAGKGFAVVADEIRVLADNSRDTANNIQTINEQVIKAVQELSSNSNTIITYIEENILPDYDSFVNSGDQYRKDASHIRHAMERFADQTKELNSLVRNIIDSITTITQGVEEGANAVSASAANTATLVDEMKNIESQMSQNKDVVEALKGDTMAFKKY